ncbi:MAG: hypothetical protein LAO23_15990 [Acidobacteriia bacterium]|nr:hypothetical protein [Terriglobia bacterium]
MLVAEIPRVPTAVRTQLEKDASFLILEASAHATAGRALKKPSHYYRKLVRAIRHSAKIRPLMWKSADFHALLSR